MERGLESLGVWETEKVKGGKKKEKMDRWEEHTSKLQSLTNFV